MPTGLQLMVLAGVLVVGGLGVLATRLVPAQPDLADALSRLAPKASQPRASSSGLEAGDGISRVGRIAARLLPGRVWVGTPTRELALLRISVARFYGDKAVSALVPLVAVPLVGVIVSQVTPVPWPIPAFVSVAAAAGMWFLPNVNVKADAVTARIEFNRALCVYLDLVAMERHAGSGPRQALETAASVGDSWVFTRISEEQARARWSGQPAWDALHALADELGLPTLDDVADIMRLSGEESAQVYGTLRARAASLRNGLLTDELAHANEANERLTMPANLLGIVFLAILLGPALMRIIA